MGAGVGFGMGAGVRVSAGAGVKDGAGVSADASAKRSPHLGQKTASSRTCDWQFLQVFKRFPSFLSFGAFTLFYKNSISCEMAICKEKLLHPRMRPGGVMIDTGQGSHYNKNITYAIRRGWVHAVRKN